MSDLANLQKWMLATITNPAGIEAGIASATARDAIDVSADEVERVVGRSRRLDAISRLAVYGNAYFARLLDCLRSEFPALVFALGEETFNTFAVQYLQSHPSRSYTLGRLGAEFPRFLRESQPETDRTSAEPTWSHLVIDLATLERTFAEVFDGPGVEDGETLQPEEIAAIPVDVWPACRLRPVPCLRLLRFDFPVHEYRSAVTRGDEPLPPAPAETRLVVTRRDYVVRRTAVEAEEFTLLSSLVAGHPVGEAVAAVADETDWTDDDLASRLHAWFRAWSASRYFDRVELPA